MTTNRASRLMADRDAAAGFTLLEMMVVLAILAGAAAIAMPNVWRRPVEPGLRATALDMAQVLRAARLQAITRNRRTGVVIDTAARLYWIEGGKSQRTIPGELAIEAALAQSGQLSDGAGRYVFNPDGSASGGAITLSGPGGRAVIAINWLSGATEVTWQR